MKKIFLNLSMLLIIAIGLTSCEKNEAAIPQPPVEKPRLLDKLIYQGVPNDPISFAYDGGGRFIESKASSFRQSFTYANNKLNGAFFDKNGFEYITITNGTLDAGGRILVYDIVFHQAGQPDVFLKDEFLYNADGYIVRSKRTNPGTGNSSQEDYVWSNGNLVTITRTSNGNPGSKEELTYYDALPNKLTMDIHRQVNNFYADGLTGKRSKQLLKSANHFNAQNVKVVEFQYNYVMDAMGYPTSYNTNDVTNNYNYTISLAYKN